MGPGRSARPLGELTPTWMSHPLVMLVAMTNLLLTCERTLVLHGDGTHECDGEGRCGADPLAHEWSVPCTDVGCGCARSVAA